MKHSHNFVNEYEEPVFGLDRKLNEEAIWFYLQKFADDSMMKLILPKLKDSELEFLHDLIFTVLKNHLTESEYHSIFLKDGTHE